MAYLFGTVLCGCCWGILYWLRKDTRRDMVWSGMYFVVVMTIGFITFQVLASVPSSQSINPGYWTPRTLFDFNNRTGGYSIEDAFFMFFTGGLAAILYESVFRKHVRYQKSPHRPHLAVLLGISAAIGAILIGLNAIYAIIAFGTVGALTIWLTRRDLILQSVIGGIIFLILYIGMYAITLALYPDLIRAEYNLANISGILPFGIPLEEYLSALSMGMMWSPIYEYIHNVRLKR